MRRLLLAGLLATSIGSSVGCITPAYSGDPTRRTQQMLYTSEDLRQALDEWERFWFLDQPSHMSPFRTHGGVI